MTEKTHSGSTLLRAKLTPPPVTRDLVVRPRLLRMLDAGLNGPLTLVVAPAGFGKTTLVSSWAQSLPQRDHAGSGPISAAWLSLDERDSEREVFLRYFIEAVRTIFPDACRRSLDLLDARQNPPESLIFDTLNNEIDRLPARFVIVLDELQNTHNRTVENLLTTWLPHWPHLLHLVILIRFTPSLPLVSLRANGQLTEIRSHDLRFTPEESEEFMRLAFDTLPDEDARTLLIQRLEGWIAGLKLAGLSWRGRAVGADLAPLLIDGDVLLVDYLIGEVFDRQTPAMRRFLLTAAIPDQFGAALLETLHGADDPDCVVGDCLDQLEAAELFLFRLDNQRQWFRFHQLFRDILRQRAAVEFDPGRIDELHRQTARWFAANQLPEQALSHALQAGDPELAAEIIADYMADALNREDRPTIERWLRLLPEETINRHAHLSLLRAWEYGFRWELAAVNRAVRQAETLVGAVEDPNRRQLLQSQIDTLNGMHAFHNNQPDRAVTLCQRAHDSLPEAWHYVRGVTGNYLGLSLQIGGRAMEAERFLTERYEAAADKHNGYALRLLLALTLSYLQQGQLDHTERTARLMLRQAPPGSMAVITGWAHYLLGQVAYYRNQPADAEQHFAIVSDLRYTTQLLTARSGLIGQALSLQALGRPADALAKLDELSRLDLELHGREQDRTAAARARLNLLQGDPEMAGDWADAFSDFPGEQPLLPWVDEPYLTKAQILIARNEGDDCRQALAILDKLEEIAARTFSNRSLIETLARRATALLVQGNSPVARATLIRAVVMARPGGFTRVFIDLGPQMQKLLQQISVEGTVARTAGRILAAFPPSNGKVAALTRPTGQATAAHPTAAPDDLEEPLTPRELEVLKFMATPISLQSIALEMGISYATARRYTVNIYGKLGVHSRWEAVDYAVRTGILSTT